MRKKRIVKNNKPLVSVIMPVYNAAEFLVEAIESILNQTYHNFEFIIINEASKDNSLSIIRSYKKEFPKKIKIVNLKRRINKGGDACVNYGFQKVKGKFIARMDADDIAHSDRLKKQVSFFLSHPEIMMVGSNAYMINREGDIIGEKNVPSDHEDIYKSFFIFQPVISPSVMIRKKFLPNGDNLYTIKYSVNNDYLTFFKFFMFGKFANIKEKLHYYRIHGGNRSLINIKSSFINSLNTRLEAIREYGYKPNLTGILVLISQIFLVFLLPERLVFIIYMLWRGMYKKKLLLDLFNIPVLVRFKNNMISYR